MTVLIAGGDSLTYGTELQSQNNTWAALLANKLNMSYGCCARPGNSNSAIVRSIMTAVKKIPSGDVSVVCMFSFPDRYEFKFNHNTGERGSPWYSITPWTHADENLVKSTMPNYDEKSFNDYKHHRENAIKTGIAGFSEMYYKHVSDDWGNYTTLKEICLLQYYLETHGINYMFLYADTSVFNGTSVEQNTLKDLVDYRSYRQVGFYQWALDNGYEFGASHPLERAHEDFCDLIYDDAYSLLML